MTAPTTTRTVRSTRSTLEDRRLRPWRWVLTALAFPPAGYLGHLIAGAVDSPAPALLGGLITGAGIGVAQWALLRHRGVSALWVAATAAGLAAGVAIGAAAVSYRTDITSLAVAGAAAGVAVGAAQSAQLPARRGAWVALNAVAWSLGWTVTTAAGIDVEQQYVVFGLLGALAAATAQAAVITRFVPTRPSADMSASP